MTATTARFTMPQLRKMTLAELEEIGREFGLTFNKNASKSQRTKRILSAYAAADVDDPEPPPSCSAQTPGSPKPDFERLIDGDIADAQTGVPSSEWGGARPGAGRPPGMTEEIAAYNRLSQQPHPAIKMGVEKIFDLWSRRTGCPAMKLTKEEAVALALPWTQAYELSPLNGKIPPWLAVLCACVWSTAIIVDSKAAAARDWRRLQEPNASRSMPAESLN